MHKSAECQHHCDSTHTVPYVPANPICAYARPRNQYATEVCAEKLIRFARTRDHETQRIRRAAWPREAARNRRCLKAACQLLHSPTHNSPTHPSVLRTSSPCRLDLRSASDARVTNAACAAHEYACVAGFTNINHLCSTNGRSPV